MTDVVHASGGKIIEDKYFLATRDQCFRQMRPDKASSASYEIAQNNTSRKMLLIRLVSRRFAGARRKNCFLAYIFAVPVSISIRIIPVRIVIVRSAGIDGVQNYPQQTAFHGSE